MFDVNFSNYDSIRSVILIFQFHKNVDSQIANVDSPISSNSTILHDFITSTRRFAKQSSNNFN